MMQKLIIIFVLVSNISYAQHRLIPTQIDSFIIQPNIEWAMYANDYLIFEKYNLNKLLFTRFENNEIKASFPTLNRTYDANHISYITKDSLDKIILEPIIGNPAYDSNGNLPDLSKIEPHKIDTTSSTFTEVDQILYIKNGTLKSYIPWVSPSIVKEATALSKEFIGYSKYLSTCYNYKYNYLPTENNSNIFLGKTTRDFNMDSTGSRSRLKELYGKNLLETLTHSILDNKFDVFSLDSNKKINLKEIGDSIFSVISAFPKLENYRNSNEEFDGYIYLANYLHLEDVKEIQLVQDWYYNYNENIVFNKIKELYLWAKKWTVNGEDKESSPILKIVFK